VNAPAGRRVWAALELLDRQLVDRDGRLAGKVDDLEFDVPDNGEELPTLTAILSGPGALASHIGGAPGQWLAAMERRLADEPETTPARIPYELVTDIDSAVQLNAGREDLDSNRAEQWVRDVIIAKIPGSGHATE
jgi:sporulation protein YlmC with PRC-barrel domain